MYYFSVTAVVHECFDILQSTRSCVADKGTSDNEETMEDEMCQPSEMAASSSSELGTGAVQVRDLNMPAGMH